MTSIYFSCRLYQLWGFSNMVSSCLPWVFSAAKPGKTAGLEIEEGSWAWDKARSACWSFNSSIVQANGDIWSVDGYRISIRLTAEKPYVQISIKSHADPSEIQHTSTFNHSSDYDVHDSHLSNGRPLDVRSVRFSSACARLSACRIFRLTCTHNRHERLQELQDHKMHLKLNLTFVPLQTCSILFLLLNHCLSQELQIWGIFRNWATRLYLVVCLVKPTLKPLAQ